MRGWRKDMPRKAKTNQEKLALAFYSVREATEGGQVFNSSKISRSALSLLTSSGWVIKMYNNWYALTKPGAKEGDTVPYFSNYWEFVGKYLNDRLGRDYVLSPLASLGFHTDSASIPNQLTVYTSKSTQGVTEFSHGLSLFVYHDKELDKTYVTEKNGIKIFSLEKSISKIPPGLFRQPTPELIAAMNAVKGIPDLSKLLVLERNAQSAARIIKALQEVGRKKEADMIRRDFLAAGFSLPSDTDIEKQSFAQIKGYKSSSAISIKLKTMWSLMSSQISTLTNPKPTLKFYKTNLERIKAKINELYVNDAYNSLSIEGYQVSEELIRKIESGKWDPYRDEQDKQTVNAMAAKGYSDAFKGVLESLTKIYSGAGIEQEIENGIFEWRRLLFGPSVRSGILKPEDLAGFRTGPVYISGSHHVPVSYMKLNDAIETYLECLKSETNPWVRAVLGHFIFVYIHPFQDGNGRIGRFIMNVLLVSAGFPWTVIRQAERIKYMEALENASMKNDIRDFSKFIAKEMKFRS